MSGAQVAGITLHKLHRLAARLVWTPDEADDLVQDALLAALEQQVDWQDERFLAWARGVVRRRAMFLARTAGRRRRREMSYAIETSADHRADVKLPAHFIDSLPHSLRTIALLANAGLGRGEIANLLGIADTALRKRISDLRRAWRASGPDADRLEPWPLNRPACGVARRSLRSVLRKLPEARLAIADPDGHEIFLSFAHKTPTLGN